MRELVIAAARNAYLSRDKGEATYWKDAAEMIKKELDEKANASWHVIVGTNFGSFFTCEAHAVIQFSVGAMVRALTVS